MALFVLISPAKKPDAIPRLHDDPFYIIILLGGRNYFQIEHICVKLSGHIIIFNNAMWLNENEIFLFLRIYIELN
jgi:hypothetical protein